MLTILYSLVDRLIKHQRTRLINDNLKIIKIIEVCEGKLGRLDLEFIKVANEIFLVVLKDLLLYALALLGFLRLCKAKNEMG